ncbi:MAG: sugar phosphate isomerase/epimerase family protein [Planctomycetota bacterium]|jgi:sugar phosphate isomerase/epimerase
MSDTNIRLTVFTKPWRGKPLGELAEFVRELGFDGVELPVRPGYQVEPENVSRQLPQAVRIFADRGLKIGTVAPAMGASPSEALIAACAEARVPIIRVCVSIPKDKDYLTAVADYQKQWHELLGLLERYGVAIGVQNHNGRYIANAMQLRHAMERYDPRHVCAVWDAGHSGLQCEKIDIALDTVWSHLRVVNLKSAYWKRIFPPDAEVAQWTAFWTTGRQGCANWPAVAEQLKSRGFAGDVCLTAEYTDRDSVDQFIAEDVRFARSLFK